MDEEVEAAVEHLVESEAWALHGGAALALLGARLAGQEAAWDRLSTRIGSLIGLAMAIAGLALAALLSRDAGPTNEQWGLLVAVLAFTAFIGLAGAMRLLSGTLGAPPEPESVIEWIRWSDALQNWIAAMRDCIKQNRDLLDDQQTWTNVLVWSFVAQGFTAGVLVVSILHGL